MDVVIQVPEEEVGGGDETVTLSLDFIPDILLHKGYYYVRNVCNCSTTISYQAATFWDTTYHEASKKSSCTISKATQKAMNQAQADLENIQIKVGSPQ